MIGTHARRKLAAAMATSVQTAVCFAGAFRNWREAWRHLQPNVVESLDADVFAVSDDAGRGAIPGVHGGADAAFTVARMRETSARASARASTGRTRGCRPISRRGRGPKLARRRRRGRPHKAFPYLFKVWRCGQLVARSGVAYDVVVRLRPTSRRSRRSASRASRRRRRRRRRV